MKIKVNHWYLFGAFLLAFIFFVQVKNVSANASCVASHTQGVGGTPSCTITVENTTYSQGQGMNWSASPASGSFFSMSPSSGSIPASSQSGSVTISFGDVGAGHYTATITISGTSSLNGAPAVSSSQSVNLDYTVIAPACTGGSLNASPNPVDYNGATTLTWGGFSNCDSSTLSGGQWGGGVNSGTPNGNGATTVGLTSPTTYTLCATGPGGGNPCHSVTVTIKQCTGGRIYADTNPINYNSSATLHWDSFANCTNATLSGGQYGGGVGTSTSGGAVTNALTSNATYTICASSPAGGSPCQSVTIVVSPPCSIASFNYSGYPGTVPYNTPATLVISTSGCTGGTISGGQYGGGAGAPTINGSFSTSNLTTSASYTFVASGPGNSSSSSISVPVGQACTVNVNATTNGVYQTPAGGYNYTITGPSTINGSGPAGYPQTPAAQNWTIVYTGGSSIPFTSYNNQSQSCSSSGGSITFTLAFNNPPPGNPTAVSAQNSTLNGAVACSNVLLNWNAGSNSDSFNIYRSDNINAVLTNVGGTSFTDTNVPSGTYTYYVQGVNAYGFSARVASNSISPTDCVADFTLSDMIFKTVNGVGLSFNSSCISSQVGPVKVIKTGDTIKTNVCVVNNGAVTATNVSVSIPMDLSNLINPVNPTNVSGGTFNYSVNNNVITAGLGNIAPGGKSVFTFDSTVQAPAGNSQKLQRIHLRGSLTYDTGQAIGAIGCRGKQATVANPCVLDTGYLVFYNGLKAPSEKEVNP